MLHSIKLKLLEKTTWAGIAQCATTALTASRPVEGVLGFAMGVALILAKET